MAKSNVIKRGIIKGKLTRFETYLNSIEVDNFKVTELKLRVANVNSLLTEFEEIQTEIEILGEEETENSKTERELFENKYFKILGDANDLIAKNETNEASPPGSVISGQSQVSGQSQASRVASEQIAGNLDQIRLPRINMPTFDGQYDQWLFFKDTYSAMVHSNNSISAIQKFQYLRLSLKGEARDVIKSLEVSGANYNIAWKLLLEQYEDKRLLVLKHIKAIFELPSSARESHEHLKKLTNELNKHMKALEVLGQPVEYWDTLIIYIILQKLDKTTRREFEAQFSEELPTMEKFYGFLKKESKFLGNLDVNVTERKNDKQKGNSFFMGANIECNNCSGKHPTYQCEELLKLSVDQRWQRVKELLICSNCFRKGHRSYDCKMRGCFKCHKRHNTVLHNSYEGIKIHNKSEPDKTIDSIEQEKSKGNNSSEGAASSETSTTLCSSFNGFTQILLSTAIVNVYDNENKIHQARILLDSGSQSHFATRDLVNKLKLPVSKINFSVFGLNQGVTKINNKVKIQFSSKFYDFETNVNCFVVPKIAEHMPSAPIDRESLNLPGYITLADETFNEVGPIDMLIGADLFWSMIGVGQYRLGKNKPIMQETVLGWIVSGPMTVQQKTSRSHCGFISDEIINKNLTRFWETEAFPETKITSPEEEFCERHFMENTRRMPDGRFIVRYPLKDSIEKLGDSKQLALRRFEQVERRLNKNIALKTEYAKFIREYEELKHSTKITNENQDKAYYLAHHCVIKKESLSTKLRVVFDASAKTTSGCSFNDLQATGPVIQQDLFSIVIRFRKHNYVLTADVTKMYRQVLIAEDQRSLQRILWRNNADEEISCYELNTVTYGTASASFLAVRCLFELANENAKKYPRTSSIIKNDFYVDDLITGGKSLEDINSIYEEITNILKSGCFLLNKWGSNDSQILKKISDSDEKMILNISEGGDSKALGLTWHATKDVLKYVVNINENHVENTKRTVLSVIARLFDPLGLLAPCVIFAKLILQRIWRHNLTWDDAIPEKLNADFEKFKAQLPKLNDLEIRRHVVCKNPIQVELHGFADASESAYGAAIYIRSINAQGKIYCNLLCAKSRVAPLKPLTVPRLELCAAFLLANLVVKVKGVLDMTIKKQFLWSDSTIALAWIQTPPHLLKVFCAHRVSEIQTLTSVEDWNFIRTYDNPADLLTRGVETNRLIENKLWWHGPKMLLEVNDAWVMYRKLNKGPEIDKNAFESEMKTIKTILIAVSQKCNLFNKFSKFSTLQRVCAYCLRFKHNTTTKKNKREFGSLTSNELANATNYLLKLATKAMHLEVVSDLTTDAFMAALQRFVSRRGNCAHIFSDNGTNFVGAQARIERLQREVRDRVDFENIKWHFIPPRAPNFGGIWEAGVKSFKTHLKRVLGGAKLNFEEFTTILTQIEACLNSRPLYPLSTDPNDPSPLTPAHFLIGEPLTSVVEAKLLQEKISPRRRFNIIQQMKQHFWNRWSKEYVSELQTRLKWKREHRNLLKLGSIVIVKEDGVPPLKWILGRVEQIHIGSDGVCRVVSLKTKTGTIKRAVTKVCVLPVPDE